MTTSKPMPRELTALMNVGPATAGYLSDVGIRTVADLRHADADDLYARLQARHGRAFDPCLHDTFTAVIHQAKTGEALPWHRFTAERKARASRLAEARAPDRGSRGGSERTKA